MHRWNYQRIKISPLGLRRESVSSTKVRSKFNGRVMMKSMFTTDETWVSIIFAALLKNMMTKIYRVKWRNPGMKISRYYRYLWRNALCYFFVDLLLYVSFLLLTLCYTFLVFSCSLGNHSVMVRGRWWHQHRINLVHLCVFYVFVSVCSSCNAISTRSYTAIIRAGSRQVTYGSLRTPCFRCYQSQHKRLRSKSHGPRATNEA